MKQRHVTRIALGLAIAMALPASLSATCNVPPTGPNAGVGPYEIVADEMYVVYSGMSDLSGQLRNLSNIYVLDGAGANSEEVWIFGAGYGDPAGDVLIYRGDSDSTRDAAADAGDVDTVIRDCLGRTPASVRLRFVVPHGHLDHVNQELFTALFALGYPQQETKIYVHTLDYYLTTCNLLCCDGSCSGEWDPYFGAPYLDTWEAATTSLIVQLGSPGSVCNAQLLSFETPTLGTWRVRFGPGHTPGAVNLDNPTLKTRFLGSAQGQQTCGAPPGAKLVNIHGPVVLD